MIGIEWPEDVADRIVVEVLGQFYRDAANRLHKFIGVLLWLRFLDVLDVLDVHEGTESLFHDKSRLLRRFLELRHGVLVDVVRCVAYAVVHRRRHEHHPAWLKAGEAGFQEVRAVHGLHVLDHLQVHHDIEPAWVGNMIFVPLLIEQLLVPLHEVELTEKLEPLGPAGFQLVQIHPCVVAHVCRRAAGEDLAERLIFAAADFQHRVLDADEPAGETPPEEVRRVIPVQCPTVACLM